MKKPKITPHYDCLDIGGERKSIDDVAEAYEEMIDALIDARKEIITYQRISYNNSAVQECVDKIEQALKKAGVEL